MKLEDRKALLKKVYPGYVYYTDKSDEKFKTQQKEINKNISSRKLSKAEIFFYKKIIDKLTTKSILINIQKKITLLSFLEKNFKKIISGNPEELEVIIKEIKNKKFYPLLVEEKIKKPNGITYKKTELNNEVLLIFNYSTFRSEDFVFDFYKKVGIKVCLYCNANYTLAITKDKNNKRLLFQLDHFFSKSLHPYLSISFSNLIPCCSNCNLYKHDYITSLGKDYHPYERDFSKDFSFELMDEWSIKSYLRIKKNKGDFLDFSKCKGDVNNYLDLYNIKEVYQQHKDLALDLILRKQDFDVDRINSLKDTFKKIRIGGESVNDYILGSYSKEEDINKGILTKFKQDIFKKIK